MLLMATEIRINVRTTAEIKRDFEIAARLKGLTVSSLVNSMAVKIIREEKDRDPAAFAGSYSRATKIKKGSTILDEPSDLSAVSQSEQTGGRNGKISSKLSE